MRMFLCGWWLCGWQLSGDRGLCCPRWAMQAAANCLIPPLPLSLTFSSWWPFLILLCLSLCLQLLPFITLSIVFIYSTTKPISSTSFQLLLITKPIPVVFFFIPLAPARTCHPTPLVAPRERLTYPSTNCVLVEAQIVPLRGEQYHPSHSANLPSHDTSVISLHPTAVFSSPIANTSSPFL